MVPQVLKPGLLSDPRLHLSMFANLVDEAILTNAFHKAKVTKLGHTREGSVSQAMLTLSVRQMSNHLTKYGLTLSLPDGPRP